MNITLTLPHNSLYAKVLTKHPDFDVAHANMGNAIRDAVSVHNRVHP